MYALVDCNSCYASVEQIFRPDLRGKPVLVLSNNDGCVIARSKEAKALGIPGFEPFFKVKPLVDQHGVHVFSANFCLYGDISHRFAEIVRRYSPQVEQYSIDELFVDLTGQLSPLHTIASDIQKTVWREIRMPVGIGVAPTKTLSKLANHAAKKIAKTNGICVLDTPAKWQWLAQRTPVNDVWGIGARLTAHLKSLRIVTAWDLAQASPKQLRSRLNVNVERTIRELNGIACIPLQESPEDKQQIFVTRSLGEKTHELAPLIQHISRYAAAAAEKLRAQAGATSAITVFLQTGPFEVPYYSQQLTTALPYPTNDTRLLMQTARRSIEQLYKPGYRYGRCGIGLLDIRDRTVEQLDLFTPGQSPAANRLMSIVDRINKRYGRDTAVFAAEGTRGKWTMTQARLSPAYTTRWADLPRIHC